MVRQKVLDAQVRHWTGSAAAAAVGYQVFVPFYRATAAATTGAVATVNTGLTSVTGGIAVAATTGATGAQILCYVRATSGGNLGLILGTECLGYYVYGVAWGYP